ncbi:MAG: hypothetical protein ACI9XC_000237 [Gammaproteobacteria bacterium]|jgi:hypothetical protein
MALGADSVNVARAMMFALGCIQSRQCHQDTCSTGVATQNPTRYKALHVEDKSIRVANYHASTIKNLMELIAVAGLNNLNELRPWHINRRVNGTETMNFAELYPSITDRCLLSDAGLPEAWRNDWGQVVSSNW